MKREPRVSVVIPVFNAGMLLGEALRSVFRQERAVGEVIVVNDGSTDAVERVLLPFRDHIRYVSQPNAGPSAARNRGIALARHDYLALLDADDLWPDGALARALDVLERDRRLAGVHGLTRLMLAQPASPADETPCFRETGRPWRSPQLGSLMFRRELCERLGPLDPSLRQGEDLDWIVRARDAGVPLARLEEVQLLYRLHARNMTCGMDARARNTLVVLKRALDRRRLDKDGNDAAC